MNTEAAASQDRHALFRNSLKYFNPRDSRNLFELAETHTFEKDELIVDAGSSRRSLYFLNSGSGRIVRSHLGQDFTIARIEAGELVGEVSYLLHNNSSSRIYADERVEASVIREDALQALLASEPGMAARFYQSLAARVAWKLRDTSQQIPLLAIDEVAQVNRFHTPRASQPEQAAVPSKLVDSINHFKEAMLTVDQGLLKKKITPEAAQASVIAAMQSLSDSLQHHVEAEGHLEQQIGAYAFRETFPLVMTSQLNDMAYSKPRGYAGDYSMIDAIYANEATGSGRLGPLVDRFLLQHYCSHAVRNRRELLRDAILEERRAYQGPNGMPLMSLACGPARELVDVFTSDPEIAILATCVDIDHEALAHSAKATAAAGAGNRVRFAQDNIIKLAGGRGKVSVAPQQLVYSIGLTDYLQDAYFISLLDWIHANLQDGGRVVIGNFATGNPGKAYMDHIMDWQLIHRTPDDLKGLFAKSKFGKAPVEVRAEAAGVNLFAFARKE